MRPTMIELDGFGSYLSPQMVDLATVDFGVVVGENGAGKSTLLNAVQFALYGTSRVSGDIDSVVHPEADRASVSLEFEFDGRVWKVTRQRVKGKRTNATFMKLDEDAGTWEVVADGSVRAVDDEIVSLLRVDQATFAATVMLGQGDADRFAAATPAERKLLLSKIIGLDRYQVLADKAKDAAAQAKTAAHEQEALIAQIDNRLTDADLDAAELEQALERQGAAEAEDAELRDRVQVLRTERENVMKVVGDTTRELDARLAVLAQERSGAERDVVDANRQVTDLSARIDRTNAAIEQAQQKAADHPKVADALTAALSAEAAAVTEQDRVLTAGQAAGDAVTGTAGEVTRLEAQIAGLTERRELLVNHHVDGTEESGQCWVCGQELTPQARVALVAEVDNELAALTADLTTAQEANATAVAERDRLRAEHRAAREARDQAAKTVSDLQRQVNDLEAAAGRVKELRADLDDLRAEHETAERALLAARRIVEGLPDPEADQTVIDCRLQLEKADEVLARIGDLVPYEAAAADAVRRVREAAAQVAQLTERCAAHERDRAERDRLSVELNSHRDNEFTYNRLREAFGRDGIPAMIFEDVVAALADHVNDTLIGLSGGTLAVELTTTKSNKTGGERDTLDVIVLCQDGTRNYAGLSGGEKQRVAVALRLGLSRLLANRHGTSIEFLAIDEGWGALDSAGIAALSECLNHLRGEFGLILTVSHIDAVKDSFATVIDVTKTVSGSEVTVR